MELKSALASEKRQLSGGRPRGTTSSGDNRSATERSGNVAFPSHCGIKAGLRIVSSAHGRDVAFQAGHAVELVTIAEFRSVQTSAEDRDGLVVDRQRHREGMAVLSSVRERKPRGIRELRRGAVY